MKKYRTEFDQPYNVTSDTKYYWNAFTKQTKLGNSKAAVIAYHEFSEARKKNFEKITETGLVLE